MDAQTPTLQYENTNFQVGMITNADTGVLITWSHFFAGGEILGPTQYGMAITTGTSVSVLTGPTVPGQLTVSTTPAPVAPVLQAQDGSFVGTFQGPFGGPNNPPTNMVAFDASGNVRWVVPNETPQIATADGGFIGQSGITYDQNGNATGQGALTTQSWRGNMYLQGSVDRMSLLPILMAQTLWAQAGANDSRNSTAGRPWYFLLVFQNNCSNNPQPCGFTLYPDNPQYLPNLAIDATSQATNIKSAALAALKKAFDKYPVTVAEGGPNTGDNRANVVDGQSIANGGTILCGSSSPLAPSHDSSVYYRANMEQSQWALPIALITAQDVQNAVLNAGLIKAIGVGVGNNAAHEIGHQFFGSGFGLDDTSKNTYNGQGCQGATSAWVYGQGVIGWENVTANAWKAALGTGPR